MRTGLVCTLSVLLVLLSAMGASGDEKVAPTKRSTSREQCLVGVWELVPGQKDAATEDTIEFRKDRTGTRKVAGLVKNYEWDLVGNRLALVDIENNSTWTINITAVTVSRLVLFDRPWYYRRHDGRNQADELTDQ